MMNNEGNKRKTVPSWTWWIVAVFIVAGIFTKIGVFTKKKTTPIRQKTEIKAKVGCKVDYKRLNYDDSEKYPLKFNPEEGAMIKLSDEKWSGTVNVSFPGMYHKVYTSRGYYIKYKSGKIDTIRSGMDNKHTEFRFKLKAITPNDSAVVITSMNPIG